MRAFTCDVAAHGDSMIEVEALSAVIAEQPNRSELYVRRAEHRIEHGDWKGAEADVCRATQLKAPTAETTRALARIYFASDRLAAARSVLDHGLKRDGSDPELLVLSARVWGRVNLAEPAFADYAAAVRLLANPSPELFLEAAALPVAPQTKLWLVETGIARLGAVVPLVERAVALELELGRTDAAVARLDQLLMGLERKEMWLKRRGDLLATAGRTAEARISYAAALASIDTLPGWLRLSPETIELANELTRLVRNS